MIPGERIKNFFRPVYEGRAAVGWTLAAVYALFLAAALRVSVLTCMAMAAMAISMGVARALRARDLWDFKVSLAGKPVELLKASKLRASATKLDGDVWLGWGYRWQPKHTALATEVLRRNLDEVYPPTWYLKHVGAQDPKHAKGLPWVQGLEEERDVIIPMKALEGHTAICAITGAIKTTLFRLMVEQFAARGDTVIILDPKGDADLKKICKDVTASLGQPERFVGMHPAFPQDSFRFDALSAWDRETQVASRIRMIMSSAEDDNFVSFVWMTVTHIVGCMKRTGLRITVAGLLDHVQSQSAAEALADTVLTRFLKDHDAKVEDLVSSRVRESDAGEGKKNKGKVQSQIASPRLQALVEYFKTQIPDQQRPKEISGLVAALEANREWFAKMVISLTPILTKLSAGDLGALLSPNYEDVDDPRPIFNARKLIDGGYVAHIGLDALSDASVAEAVAGMIIADVAATAGEIYNYEDTSAGRRRRIHLICDEWGDLACEPLIHIANKGRGAGLQLYVAGQTFSDLVVKLGNVNIAKRFLGNMNNMIVGATSDSDTLDMIMSKLGETAVADLSVSQGAGQKTEDAGLEFSANRSTSVRMQSTDLVPPNVIMGLPDLQYIAVVNRAQIFKGRIPALVIDGPTGAQASAALAPRLLNRPAANEPVPQLVRRNG